MKAEDLKNSILQLAMQGKLVPQDPNDEPASVLLEKIHKEKEKLIKDKKIKRNNKESFIFRKNGHFYEKIGKKEKPVCIDDEIPFDVPNSWEWIRINTIREVYTGNSINKTEKETKFTGLTEGYNYIATKDVKFDNSIDYNNGVKIPKDLEKFRVAPEGSVLLCIEGGSAGRKIGILNQNVCFGNKLACFKTFKDNNDFLFYYLQSPNFKEIFKSKKTGIIGGVGITKLRNVLIPIPPLNEQKRIINEINKLNPLINEYMSFKEQLDKLNSEFPDKLKSSILQEAIQGKLVPQDSNDESASVLLERIRDEKERLIKEKKIKRNKNESYIFKENNHFYEKTGKEIVDITKELPFEIPDNWMWCKLENISSNIHYGYTASAQEVGDVKLLRITDIHENNVNWDSVPYCVISDDKLAIYILRNRDIVMARTGGTIGKSYIINNLNKKAVFASYLIRIIPLKNINENYLKQFFESPLFWNQLRDNTKGTGQPNVNAKSLKSLLIPLPPFIEQEMIVNKIEKIFNEINLRLKV